MSRWTRAYGALLIVTGAVWLSPTTGWPLGVGIAYLLAGIALLTGRR